MNYIRFFSGLYYAGLIIFLSGIIMHLTDSESAVWLLSIGLIPILGVRIYNFLIAPPQRKRINAILMTSAVFLVVATISISYGREYWIVFIAVSAVLYGYVSFRKHT
jgi:general stress protein CsbA